MNIIPGILARTPLELSMQLSRVTWAKKLHVDIMDGKFVPNKTVTLLTLKKYLPKISLQVHLMAYKPHLYIDKFARLGAKEIIVHAESSDHIDHVLLDIKKHRIRAGIALNPETKVEHCKAALAIADTALVMTVKPGFSGQEFMTTAMKKISQIRKIKPTIRIGVDGGINEDTIRLVKDADFAVATSAVTLAQDPKKAYARLKR